MKFILLYSSYRRSYGKYKAIVDDEDYDELSKHEWSLIQAGKTKDRLYAYRSLWREGTRGILFMHNVILPTPSNKEVDHKDRNGLNNSRSNLREVTRSQNITNSRKRFNTSSKYKGVNWNKQCKKWVAKLSTVYSSRHLGVFLSEEEAARAWDKADLEAYGEYARLNFPSELEEVEI